jgi:hypothetical protein
VPAKFIKKRKKILKTKIQIIWNYLDN